MDPRNIKAVAFSGLMYRGFAGLKVTVFVWSLGFLLCRCTWHYVCSGLYCVSVCGISHDAAGEVNIQRR